MDTHTESAANEAIRSALLIIYIFLENCSIPLAFRASDPYWCQLQLKAMLTWRIYLLASRSG